ncbi:MAG: tRNA (adenosine(37)-N6)-threonylcarbamoyltransferase complex dimerization subunit type 1 TsaB [Candidatus Eisenbacteria bacterium]|nr:tRNA (adenosine(37)-N6)-threonylcarbamoyltransferase complex dimerization subunit type 1 TsaB [Candidatus Eisenbacteria bacterium]
MIIAVETSTTFASAAAVRDGTLLAETCLFAPQGHCENLLPMLETLLTGAGLDLAQATAFAVSLGPGSFTALRIGLSTVKALAMASRRPLVGVGTLDALAFNAAGLCSHVCPIIDAKRGEVFYSLFRDESGRQERLLEYGAQRPDEAIALLSSFMASSPEGKVIFLGDGVEACRGPIEAQFGGRAIFAPPHLGTPRASAVGVLALALLERGRVEDVAGVEPIYVRRSDAEIRRQRP